MTPARSVVTAGTVGRDQKASELARRGHRPDIITFVPLPSKDWDMGEPAESPGRRAGVILTPDQRLRVFISSTLEELAAERGAARRAIRRLHLVPVWYE